MTKKKAKSKKRAKKTGKKRTVKTKAETNPVEVRKEVSNMVKAEATAMAQAVIDEAKKGQVAQTRYMFEVASIYPPAGDGEHATQEEDCLAKMLLDKIDPPKKTEEEALVEKTEGQSSVEEVVVGAEKSVSPGSTGAEAPDNVENLTRP